MKKHLTIFSVLASSILLMSNIVDLNNLFNYANQGKPTYIVQDNTTAGNSISDKGATLGRVLFYDKKLSVNNTIACASCHIQAFAFGDTAVLSRGWNGGLTGRHSMRLVNARFSNETRFFWDERAATLEKQTTQPIQDHVEMGFSGQNGDPAFDALVNRLKTVDYYQELFSFVYGDAQITEARIQNALAQFVRSIQSFDSKYDAGRKQVGSNGPDFPNFTAQENLGKRLFFNPPPLGGAACFRCHGGTEFATIPDLGNNGVIGVANQPGQIDLTNTKAPTLRDLVNPNGQPNGPMMHNGKFKTLLEVINHYNDFVDNNPANTNLDHRMQGPMHDINLNQAEKEALVAFLGTLTGEEVYTAEKWSNPFDSLGQITVLPLISSVNNQPDLFRLDIFPNPTTDKVTLRMGQGGYRLTVFDSKGTKVKSIEISDLEYSVDLSLWPFGTYFFQIENLATKKVYAKKVVKG